jgi:hypothetical protein
MKKLPFFERNDRSDVTDAAKGIADVAFIAEGVLLIEKYALSVSAVLIDGDESVEWVALDPLCLYRGSAYTPIGAVIMWDCHRQSREGKDDDRNKPLRLVKR